MKNCCKFNTPDAEALAFINGTKKAKKEGVGLSWGQKRFLGGLLRVLITVGFYVSFGAYWGESFHKSVQPSLEQYINKPGSEALTWIIICAVNITLIVSFVKGFYKMWMWDLYNDVFEGKNLSGTELSSSQIKSSNQSSNIQKAFEYRNSKISMMDNESASNLVLETSALNNVLSNERTASYLNSKMSMMSNEARLGLLKGK